MVWFYTRDNTRLSIETRYDNEAFEYVATVFHPDDRRDIERFDRRELFAAWLQAFEQRLESERWTADGSALVDGWPDKPPMM